ncbi:MULTISPECIES: AraC family transcriptional regulator [unclassified Bradyrhizobium]|uniref:AraC family transcriptional regulator n=1 Tax=unclassified Bradyrhizobium TaxID=2631580 RepID=UPI00247A2B1F|nr:MULTISPECIES: AraC family transcriptional regulator [unclassified Bradyrhizobium]WGR70207.1 helix-turn-helix domain-containing protein [Bradyrhizobium sp. ISRA426]WGR82264.1 helix-turn-helix domain-containing protein [Bradyrhizobium sp. ISRA430]WGR85450.1 helix-turn-helix domain-containing protein [Bradyrhizobium sp. ISRA432]
MPWSRVLSFSDPLDCQAAILAADVEILPTTKDDFEVEITQIGANRLWVQGLHASAPTVCTVACKPERRSIGFLTESNSSPLQHCGLDVSPGDIIVNRSDVVHRRSGHDFNYGSLSLPTDELNQAIEAIIGRELVEQSDPRIVHPHPQLMSRLLKRHWAIRQLAHHTPDVLQIPEVLRALENELIHVMVRCLADGIALEPTTGDRHHDAIVARFEEFLAANPDRPLYLTEICGAIGVAERTLRASCEEHLGMGPIRFLTLRRMHLARYALLRADPLKSTVTRIVADHGFWELGRFSVAYRALFGESPSETLRRPAERIAVHLNRPSSLAVTEPGFA